MLKKELRKENNLQMKLKIFHEKLFNHDSNGREIIPLYDNYFLNFLTTHSSDGLLEPILVRKFSVTVSNDSVTFMLPQRHEDTCVGDNVAGGDQHAL